MNEIRFNPGHTEAMQDFLKGRNTISPEDLANQAETATQVEHILLILQQELSNTAMPIQFFDYLVEDMEVAAKDLNEENASKLIGLLEGFEVIMSNGETNAPLIVECMNRIRQADAVAVEAGSPTLLTEKSKGYVETITRDSTMISKAFEGKTEQYKQIYVDSMRKLNEYLQGKS